MKSKPSFSATLRLCGYLVLIALCSLLTINAQTRDYTQFVNPFIGTGGHGHTFPGATVPFGMVQLSPDTRTDNWDGSSGYHYSDDIIYGFSHTHLSGTGIPDGCDILFMPTVGEPLFLRKDGDRSGNGYASKFSHSDEKAEPGYYSVKLDNDISAEMTATARVGFHRYTFPAGVDPRILLDLTWRDKTLMSEIHVKGDRIEGWRRSSSWAKDQKVYFSAQFSQPFAAPYWGRDNSGYDGSQSWVDTSIGEHIRVVFPFNQSKERRLLLKVAISSVSIEGARKNLEAELPGWDFDKVRADAKAAWNKELSKIEVSGGTPEETTNFYTALYHTAIQPNVFNDVDGRYRGHDGKVHVLSPAFRRPGGTKRPPEGGTPSDQYTVFSLWDTFRAAHPLYTIIDEKRTVDFINTFIRQYEQGGRLPVWELWGEETDTMIGYHAVSVIADAMTKGIKGFDYEKAFEAAKHSAELDHFGLAAYKRRGYISMEDENESVSKTLEYAYDDWCIAQMAAVLGGKPKVEIVNGKAEMRYPNIKYAADYARYFKRGKYYQNLFDPTTGFMRPKRNGGFVSPFSPNEVTFHFTEGNSWVYTFFVPQDVLGLMELMGGSSKFAAKLDELFTTSDKLTGRVQPDITGLIGQYAHGNEPSHHIAYLYNYAHQPWKTQKYVRQILDQFYKPTPDGLIGNEDCGEMSAWYILSALGLYQVTPGDPTYQIGTPLFKEAKIHLENGKTFTIKAPNVSSKNIYIKSKLLDGKALIWATGIKHEDIISGGTLEFEMSSAPVPFPGSGGLITWKRSDLDWVSVAGPVIGDGTRTFKDSFKVVLSTVTPGAKVYYTLDGSVPTEQSSSYVEPLTLTSSTTVKAIAINQYGRKSLVSAGTFLKKPNDWTVSIASKYSRQYDGGGDDGLIDGIRGTVNFASGEWQGYQGQDFEAVIDLQRPTKISELGGGFLQVARSWIWMPTKIEFEVSDDNVSFKKVTKIVTDLSPEDMTPTARDYVQKIKPVTARYVRVHATNFGKIPAWHPGAGFDAYIFVDEIIIR